MSAASDMPILASSSDDMAAGRHAATAAGCMAGMLTIAVFSQKGGAGKSTVAMHLAVAASQTLKVVLIDADPQATVATWAADRTSPKPFVARTDPALIERLLTEARGEDYELAIVDCPPHAAPGTLALLRAADHIVIPAQPTMPDLAATARSVALARAAGRTFSFVVNRAPNRAPEVTQALDALSAGGTVSPVVIGDRRAFSRALTEGMAVTEFASSASKAAGEVANYWNWLYAHARKETWATRQAA